MTNENRLDKITGIIKKALDILFVSNPKGTSLGIFAGILLQGLVGLFNPILSAISYIDIKALKLWHYISAWIVIFNLPDYFRRNKIDPKIDEALIYIKRQLKEGSITYLQAQQMYINLHAKVVSSIVLNEKANQSMRKFEKSLSSGIEKD